MLMNDDVVGKLKPRDEVKYYPEYWAGKKLAYPHVTPQHPKFSRSVVVGNLIFISGCQGQNDDTLEIPTTFEEQMLNALNKIKKAMEEAGSSMNNIVKTLILLKNLEDYPRMRKTELEYYQKHAPFLVENPPASTVAVVASLARPEFLIEIDAIGYIP
ncbi:MAG: RidA family protein [Candidatus Bathyarchaeia archaeon]